MTNVSLFWSTTIVVAALWARMGPGMGTDI